MEPAGHPPIKHLPPRPEESFRVMELSENASGCSWHFHPEYQLSVVVSGEGTRVIGDDVRAIECGEVVLLGSNLPHVWHYDATACEVSGVVVHFDRHFAGADFLGQPEMRMLRTLLTRARQGLEVCGEIRVMAASILKKLPNTSGFDRVLTLLKALNTLADSNELHPISSAGFGADGGVDLERLRCVYTYLDAHYQEPITREQVAALAHLNPNAFSRFFHQRSGITFQEYLTEKRIGRACELLMDAARTITDIALDCGFASSTSFARAFRRVKGMAPSTYRRQGQAFRIAGSP